MQILSALRLEDKRDGLGCSQVPPYTAGFHAPWSVQGPCHKQRFMSHPVPRACAEPPAFEDSAGGILARVAQELFASQAFAKWLMGITEIVPKAMNAQVWGDRNHRLCSQNNCLSYYPCPCFVFTNMEEAHAHACICMHMCLVSTVVVPETVFWTGLLLGFKCMKKLCCSDSIWAQQALAHLKAGVEKNYVVLYRYEDFGQD